MVATKIWVTFHFWKRSIFSLQQLLKLYVRSNVSEHSVALWPLPAESAGQMAIPRLTRTPCPF